MSLQTINQKLDINPGAIPPRIKVSQYDEGSRLLTFKLYNGSVAFTTADVSAKIQGTKPDNKGFAYDATYNAGTVTANLDIQMTCVAGDVICELVLTKDDEVLGTGNFVLEVEASALSDDVPMSATELPAYIVPIATTSTPGKVKPDGSTVTIDADGTIHSSGGSGGSTVTITPLYSGGTKIADYSIDGTSGELHAPTGGLPETPLSVANGGTGNSVGYIQTGVKANTTVGTRATIEGSNNTGSGTDSHTEGSGNTASGAGAHAEGSGTKASGTGSHAGGNGTIAGHAYQTVIGKHNNNKSNTLFEVGNGSSSSSKSNAFEVYNNGDVVVAGTLKDANNNAYLKGIVPTANGGTGNAYGYIRTGQLSGSTIGTGATAEGTDTTASGSNAHAEGEKTIASAQGAHAEGGYYTSSNTDYPATASGKYAHAEGEGSTASGEASHAEGTSIASGAFAHAEGANTSAIGNFSHAEGHAIAARGEASHVEGYNTNVAAGAIAGHAEGYVSSVTEDYAHAEGYGSEASGTAAHAEGTSTVASGDSAHAEGGMVIIDDTRHYTTASGDYSHAEGEGSVASGDFSHAEGKLTTADGDGSHAEGISTRAYLEGAHAEGAALTILDTTYMTTANGIGAHAEGRGTTAETNGTHAEGQQTHASAYNAHAEGSLTAASGVSSHAEGVSTTASAMGAHAEGQYSTASGEASHAGGLDTIAGYDYQTAIGKYNSNSSSNVLEVGNGEDDSHRSNALELTSSGSLSVARKITAGVGGELDFTRTGIYNGLCGEDNDIFLLVDTLVVDTDNSFTISKCKGVMFRLGLHADFSMWGFDGTQPVTLKVNNTTAYPIKINGIAMTTDDWTPKQGITYFAQLVYENASDLYPGDPYWYISESVTADEIQRIDDALFNDDVKIIDYTNVITLQNAPDVHAQSLKVKFAPIQSGSGDPSPNNVRPISGHTGASAVVLNGTLYKKTSDFEQGAYLTDGSKNDSSEALSIRVRDNTIHMMTAGTYRISCKTTQNKTVQMAYQTWANDTYGENTRKSDSGWVALGDITLSEDTYFSVGFRYSNNTAISLSDLTISITSVSPSETHTTPFGDTYYSGYVDVVTGELVVTHAKKTITGSESGVTYDTYQNPLRATLTGLITNYKRQTDNNAVCDRFVPVDNSSSGAILAEDDNAFNFGTVTGREIRFNLTGIGLADASAFQSYLQAQYAAGTPVEVVYELATPLRIPLTPQLVKLFKGYNTIYSDAGQVRLEYTANLITCLNEDIAKKADNASLGYVENGNTASRAYTANDIIVWQGQLVKATTSIASGAAFTLGTNVVSTSLGELITAILNA